MVIKPETRKKEKKYYTRKYSTLEEGGRAEQRCLKFPAFLSVPYPLKELMLVSPKVDKIDWAP